MIAIGGLLAQSVAQHAFTRMLSFKGFDGSGLAGALGVMALGALFPQDKQGEVGKLRDRTFMGSAYGTVLPRIWGNGKVGPHIDYLYKDAEGSHFIETVEDRKKSPDEHKWTCSGYMSFCESSLFFPDNQNPSGGTIKRLNFRLAKLIANGTDVIFETDESGVITHNPHGFVIASGDESQTAPSGIQSLTGLGSNTPAHVGKFGLWFENFDVTKWGTIPQLEAHVVQMDPVETGDVLSDILRMHGLKTAEFDVIECYNSRVPGGAGMTVQGFKWDTKDEARAAINQILKIYDIDLVEVDGLMRFLPRASAAVFDIDSSLLGATTGGPGSAPRLIRTARMSETRPRAVQIWFIDPDNNYESDFVEAIVGDNYEGSDLTVSTMVVLKRAEAQKVANRERDRQLLEFDPVSISVPMHGIYYAPGDKLRVIDLQGDQVTFRIEKMGLGIGVIPISGSIVDDDVLTQISSGSPPANNPPPTPAPIVPSVFTVFSTSEIIDAHRTTPGFYVAATGGAGWQGGQVYYKLSSSTEYLAGPSINSKAVFGVSTGVLSDAGAVAGALDITNTVGVNLSASLGTLSPYEASAVEAGTNWAWLGAEIIGVVDPVLTSANNYDLTENYRGLQESPMSGHASGERFVLANNGVARIQVPEEHAGLIYDVKVVSVGQSIGSVTAQQVTIATRRPTSTELLVEANSFGLTIFEADLGAVAKTGGNFVKSGFSGLEVGRPLLISQAVGPYTGKGTLEDEFEMGAVLASAKIISTTEIKVWWFSSSPMRGNVKFQICMG